MVIPHDVNKHQRCEISQLARECFAYLSSVNRVGVYFRFRCAVIKMTGMVLCKWTLLLPPLSRSLGTSPPLRRRTGSLEPKFSMNIKSWYQPFPSKGKMSAFELTDGEKTVTHISVPLGYR